MMPIRTTTPLLSKNSATKLRSLSQSHYVIFPAWDEQRIAVRRQSSEPHSCSAFLRICTNSTVSKVTDGVLWDIVIAGSNDSLGVLRIGIC